MTDLEDRRERTFIASDGIEIRYEIFGARSPEPPVVLHHGFGADTLVNWVLPGVVSALTDAGRWLVSIDARGHGKSAKPKDPAHYGESAMASDLVELLHRLEVFSYDLVGYSMGAIVALLVAAGDSRVRRLVIGGVGAGAVELGGVDTRVLAPAAIVAAMETEDPERIADPMARQFRMFADATRADRLALAAQARAVHAAPIAFDCIRAPTLVIAGESDELAARPEVLARTLPRARLERVRGDHMAAILDRRFSALILGFLA